jgi:leucyl aminopeptidase (aminopeptidase T)
MITLEEGALRVVQTCAGTKRGERVLVITDEQRPPEIADALAEAARRVGAEPTVALVPAVGPQGGEPPPDVASAMRTHDVVLAPTTRSVFHTAAARDAAVLGARILSLVGCGVSTLTTGGIEADFETLETRCLSVANRLTSARDVEVSTVAGTRLLASIEGRSGIGNTGMARNRGEVVGCPIIEAYIAPIEGSAEGVLVIDGSTPFGLLSSPIEIVIESGRATDIRGGPDSERIVAAVDVPGDPACRALAEVALGLNPLARVTGNLNEDEGAHRTGHFALGNNAHMGGTNWAPTHIDMVYLQPTVSLDGVIVMRGGELVD